VKITGTARLPHAELVSDPPVPDGEKLSWLIMGQGLDKATSADTGNLQTAAALLYGATIGSPGGRPLANKIGLDEVGVGRRASGAEGQVMTLGKRITDRLYLAYEQGLNVTSTALKIEYTLTRFITLRADVGQEVNGIGIYYNRSYP
jgi:translocation and assembly module TamB